MSVAVQQGSCVYPLDPPRPSPSYNSSGPFIISYSYCITNESCNFTMLRGTLHVAGTVGIKGWPREYCSFGEPLYLVKSTWAISMLQHVQLYRVANNTAQTIAIHVKFNTTEHNDDNKQKRGDSYNQKSNQVISILSSFTVLMSSGTSPQLAL